MDYLVCSDCFKDEGLRIDAQKIGEQSLAKCPVCKSEAGLKFNEEKLFELTYRFFVWGSFLKTDFGGAPLIQFNEYQETSIDLEPNLKHDADLIGENLGVGFFHYGPRLWLVGEIEPLKKLAKKSKRKSIIKNIIQKYPKRIIDCCKKFYRIRKSPKNPELHSEYDSPPNEFLGVGRFDSNDSPILYASEDL